ncbi:glycosyltransferase [Listeria fleischmannii]|jgi:hyaluronan synthase|uniref:Hyaluronan synthase n=1 Tax=Listeria fleischmannii FSL S10-1203 TaxID=1265822 RepID=W7DAD9_9LIST|nr:glycosyltransferase family 2 protein [Listeria fleischmannii]EUJ51511.1 hyaluronan synthase [Listeria fleischmannii FSL S10-1203]
METIKMAEETRKKEHQTGTHIALSLFTFMLCAILIGMIGFWRTGQISTAFSIYGWGMIIYLVIKTGLSMFYRRDKHLPPNLDVTVVIPLYNESKEALFRLLAGLEKQTYPVKEIFIVDDGSPEDILDELMNDLRRNMSPEFVRKIHAHKLSKNQGKRFAQAYAFKKSTGDVFFTMDSDGEIYPDTLYELMRPFSNDKVQAVTGHINARNRKSSLLSYLLDMRYDNAFRVERASQSVTGNILVCSGPISCYRRAIVMDNLDRYLNQTVLGAPAHVGDDRCLTNYANERGKTVYQESAKCVTDVPEKMSVFLKQQTRWSKSFFRETFISMKLIMKKPFIFLWSITEIALWVIFLMAVVYNIIFHFWDLTWQDWLFYLLLSCLSAYARNVHYMFKYPFCYLLAPIYGFIHFFTIHIVRIIALCTLRVNKWGTRSETIKMD